MRQSALFYNRLLDGASRPGRTIKNLVVWLKTKCSQLHRHCSDVSAKLIWGEIFYGSVRVVSQAGAQFLVSRQIRRMIKYDDTWAQTCSIKKLVCTFDYASKTKPTCVSTVYQNHKWCSATHDRKYVSLRESNIRFRRSAWRGGKHVQVV